MNFYLSFIIFNIVMGVCSKNIVTKSGLEFPIPNGIGLKFFAEINNTSGEDCSVEVHPDECCLDVNDSKCNIIELMGSAADVIPAGTTSTLQLVAPLLEPYNRRGYCSIYVDFKPHSRPNNYIRDTIKIKFDTTLHRSNAPEEAMLCKHVDEDPLNECKPVNCDTHYNGKRAFFNMIKKRCVDIPACIAKLDAEIPHSAYNPISNKCITKPSITKEDVEFIKALTGGKDRKAKDILIIKMMERPNATGDAARDEFDDLGYSTISRIVGVATKKINATTTIAKTTTTAPDADDNEEKDDRDEKDERGEKDNKGEKDDRDEKDERGENDERGETEERGEKEEKHRKNNKQKEQEEEEPEEEEEEEESPENTQTLTVKKKQKKIQKQRIDCFLKYLSTNKYTLMVLSCIILLQCCLICTMIYCLTRNCGCRKKKIVNKFFNYRHDASVTTPLICTSNIDTETTDYQYLSESSNYIDKKIKCYKACQKERKNNIKLSMSDDILSKCLTRRDWHRLPRSETIPEVRNDDEVKTVDEKEGPDNKKHTEIKVNFQEEGQTKKSKIKSIVKKVDNKNSADLLSDSSEKLIRCHSYNYDDNNLTGFKKSHHSKNFGVYKHDKHTDSIEKGAQAYFSNDSIDDFLSERGVIFIGDNASKYSFTSISSAAKSSVSSNSSKTSKNNVVKNVISMLTRKSKGPSSDPGLKSKADLDLELLHISRASVCSSSNDTDIGKSMKLIKDSTSSL